MMLAMNLMFHKNIFEIQSFSTDTIFMQIITKENYSEKKITVESLFSFSADCLHENILDGKVIERTGFSN